MSDKVIFLDIDGVLNAYNHLYTMVFKIFGFFGLRKWLRTHYDVFGVRTYRVFLLWIIVKFTGADIVLSSSWRLGYFKENSHDLTNIKFCPLQPEIMNRIAQFIRENYTLGCYNETKTKGLLKHVITRISADSGDILITFVLNTNQDEFTEKYENQIKTEFIDERPLLIEGAAVSDFRECPCILASISAQKLIQYIGTMSREETLLVVLGMDKVSSEEQEKFIPLLKERQILSTKLSDKVKVLIPVKNINSVLPAIQSLTFQLKVS